MSKMCIPKLSALMTYRVHHWLDPIKSETYFLPQNNRGGKGAIINYHQGGVTEKWGGGS